MSVMVTPPPNLGGGNLSEVLAWAGEQWGQRTALVHGDLEISYAELERRVRQAAGALAALGVRAGDRVGIQLPNSPAFVTLFYATLRLGAIVVPQNPLASIREADQNFRDADVRLVLGRERDPGAAPEAGYVAGPASPASTGASRVVIDDDEATALLRTSQPWDHVTPVDPGQTAVILYTSGTTGAPKGAELTHANLGLNTLAALDIYSLVPDDVVLGVLPLYHSYGQTCTLNASVAVGARLILVSRFDGELAAAAIRRHGVTLFLGVPTMFSDVAHVDAPPANFASLRMCASGGAPLPADVLAQFESRTGAGLYETYGLSETSPIASFNGMRGERRPGTVGWAIPGTEIKVVPVAGQDAAIGEVAIRGHNIMKGYWRNAQATRDAIDPAGWFHSGDLGTIESDGALRIVGRLKDMIIRGGLNVYPREIEDLLHTHPQVRAAAVVGVPDARLGEEVAAAVELEDDAEITADQLQTWIRQRVAPYKYPRYLWTVDALPKGPTGKILKRVIEAPAAALTNRGGTAS